MKLANRAAFAIVFIAIADAFLAAIYFEVLAGPWRSELDFGLVAMISGFFSFIVGGIAAMVVLPLGHKLPQPRLAWLAATGVVLGATISSLLMRLLWPHVAIMGGVLGLASAILWWLFVERYRQEPSEM